MKHTNEKMSVCWSHTQ